MFYERFQEKLEELTIKEFTQWTKDALKKYSNPFEGYAEYLHTVLPLVKAEDKEPLSSQILKDFNKEVLKAMKTINSSGYFSFKHKIKTLFMATIAESIGGPIFLRANSLN